jgi:hypothetical protein
MALMARAQDGDTAQQTLELLGGLERLLKHRLAAAAGTHAESVEGQLRQVLPYLARLRLAIENHEITPGRVKPLEATVKNLSLNLPGQLPILLKQLEQLFDQK